MSIVISKPDSSQLKAEALVMRKTAKKLAADPEKARKFLIKGGFITKGGKLTKRYGG